MSRSRVRQRNEQRLRELEGEPIKGRLYRYNGDFFCPENLPGGYKSTNQLWQRFQEVNRLNNELIEENLALQCLARVLNGDYPIEHAPSEKAVDDLKKSLDGLKQRQKKWGLDRKQLGCETMAELENSFTVAADNYNDLRQFVMVDLLPALRIFANEKNGIAGIIREARRFVFELEGNNEN